MLYHSQFTELKTVTAFIFWFLISLSTYIGYYNRCGKNKAMYGVLDFFVSHFSLIEAISINSFVGFWLFMIVKEWKWTSSKVRFNLTHFIIGNLTIDIIIIQMWLDLLGPDKDSPKRPIFNWLHKIFGIFSYVFTPKLKRHVEI
ncbi:isoform e [Brachionus plicatilis]|uniref:Isoform e n=1 Tax=Brachionus plicatilis TaxID=10195 RepID=A0A3M7P3P0_BRAPC|nr:isoform e [Brachionus plicatilis]